MRVTCWPKGEDTSCRMANDRRKNERAQYEKKSGNKASLQPGRKGCRMRRGRAAVRIVLPVLYDSLEERAAVSAGAMAVAPVWKRTTQPARQQSAPDAGPGFFFQRGGRCLRGMAAPAHSSAWYGV